jgi:hypothetical protein
MMVPTVASAATEQLALKALSAATQLDRMTRGKDASLEAVRNFAQALSNFPGWTRGPEAGELSLDPTSSEMFNMAVFTATERQVTDLTELVGEMEKLRKQFESLSDKESMQAIGRVRDFCLAIHDYVMRSNSQSGLVEHGVFEHEYNCPG